MEEGKSQQDRGKAPQSILTIKNQRQHRCHIVVVDAADKALLVQWLTISFCTPHFATTRFNPSWCGLVANRMTRELRASYVLVV
jgi:hypothetical protein